MKRRPGVQTKVFTIRVLIRAIKTKAAFGNQRHNFPSFLRIIPLHIDEHFCLSKTGKQNE